MKKLIVCAICVLVGLPIITLATENNEPNDDFSQATLLKEVARGSLDFNDIKDIYLRLVKQGMNIGMEILAGLEKKLKFSPYFNDVYKDKMDNLREKTFKIHPELKDNLGKPIFIYDEKQNMMILKGIE